MNAAHCQSLCRIRRKGFYRGCFCICAQLTILQALESLYPSSCTSVPLCRSHSRMPDPFTFRPAAARPLAASSGSSWSEVLCCLFELHGRCFLSGLPNPLYTFFDLFCNIPCVKDLIAFCTFEAGNITDQYTSKPVSTDSSVVPANASFPHFIHFMMLLPRLKFSSNLSISGFCRTPRRPAYTRGNENTIPSLSPGIRHLGNGTFPDPRL